MNLNVRRITGVLFTLGFLVLLWYVSTIVIYFLISVVVSLICRPILGLLDKIQIKGKSLPNWASALTTLILVYVVLFSFLRIFTPILAEEISIISSLDLNDTYAAFEEPLKLLERKAEEYNLHMDETMSNREYVQSKVFGLLDISQIPDLFANVISGLGNVLVAFFSITFITFFLLKDRWIVGQVLFAVTPDKYLDKVREVFTKSKKTLSRYFIGLLAQITLITTLVSISLSLFGVRNALIIGFFAGLINVIPYLGPLIGATFGLIIGITTNLDADTSLYILTIQIASVFATVQMLDNFIFQPVIFSNSINAHPLEIFLVIMVAGQIAGITGMVLAVPSYSFLRIVGAEFFSEFKVVKHLTKDV